MTDVVGIYDYMDVVERPVLAVHRIYRHWVTYAELRQEAAVWWYGPGQAHLHKYIDEDNDHVLLRRSIWRWCARYAEREKAHASGYEPIDQANYSTREILALLPVALETDRAPGFTGMKPEGPVAKGNLAEGGTHLAAVMDIRRALDAITDDDVEFLALAEDLRHDWERVVTHLGSEIQPDSARRQHTRIVKRIAQFLNGAVYEERAS